MVGKGDKGEVRVTNPRIEVETRLTQRGAEISVKDNGPGIPSEVRDRIFEPLFTTKNFGTGLGLPAVENILRQHGGGIELDSAIGKGTDFRLWLPLADKQLKASA